MEENIIESLYTQAVAFLCDIQFAETSPTKERRDSLLYQTQRRIFKRKAEAEPLATFKQSVIDHMEKDQNPSHKRSFLCALGEFLNICQNSRGNQQIENLAKLRVTYCKNKVNSNANTSMVETITYVLINTLADPIQPLLP